MDEPLTRSAEQLSVEVTPQDLDETLQRITAAAVEVLPEVDCASITITHSDGTLETVAPTDLMLCEVDKAQYDLREGPCYQAATETSYVSSPDLADDERFPRYAGVATAAGLHAQIGLRLFDAPGFQGALNLYSTRVGAFQDLGTLGALFTHQSAETVRYAREAHDLKRAAETRETIGAAVGVAIERYGLSESRAFAFLSRLAAKRGVDVVRVARDLIDASEERSESH